MAGIQRYAIESEIVYNNTIELEDSITFVPLRVLFNIDDHLIGVPFPHGNEEHCINALDLKTCHYKWCIKCGTIYNKGNCCIDMTLWVPETTSDNVDCVIYHGGCQDGVGSFWSVHRMYCRKYGHERAMSCVTGTGSTHNTASDQKSRSEIMDVVSMCKGKHVLVADFAYDKNIIRTIKKACASFILLDHHDSNKTMLTGEPNCYFDESHSGAYWTWAWVVTGVPLMEVKDVPKVVAYIQDRDLWKFELPHSREISSAMYLESSGKIESFDIFDSDKNSFETLRIRGTAYLEYEREIISMIVDSFSSKKRFLNYTCATVNSGFAPSDVCDYMLASDKYRDCQIAIAIKWMKELKQIKFYVRRRKSDNHINVGDLCKILYKGGGHPEAAGFVVPDTTSLLEIFSDIGQENNNRCIEEDMMFMIFKERGELYTRYSELAIKNRLKYDPLIDTLFGYKSAVISTCFRPSEVSTFILSEKTYVKCRLCVVFFWDTINSQFVFCISKRQTDFDLDMKGIFKGNMCTDITAVMYFKDGTSISTILEYCRNVKSV